MNRTSTETYDGIATEKYVYDPKTNLRIQETYCNSKGGIVYDYHYKYDNRGNLLEEYANDAKGKLISFDDEIGAVKMIAEYNDRGKKNREYYKKCI